MLKNKIYWIVIAICFIIFSIAVSFLFPEYSMQIKAAGILIASMVLWVSEVLPISISTLLLLAILPIIDLMDFNTVINKFGTSTSLFIMASSGITVALVSSSIPNQIVRTVFDKCQKRPILLVYIFGIVIALFSAFVSSLATCTLFSMMTSAVLSKTAKDAKKTNMGKSLMLIIPACSGIGGFMSPAGTPANLLVIDLLEENGISISFAKWCAIGFPIGLLAVIIFATSVILHFKPEANIEFQSELKQDRKKSDYIVLVVVLATIIGWVLSSFISVLNITMVAILSLCILFIPQFNTLNIKKFQEGVNWDLVIAMGSVSVLMSAISDTGLIQNGVNIVFGNLNAVPVWIVLIISSLCICFFRSFIPTTTAVIALFAPIVISISSTSGISVATLLLTLAFWAAAALLLVFTEPIYLIAYKEGYFKAGDLFRTGIIPCLILSACVGFAINFLVNILL